VNGCLLVQLLRTLPQGDELRFTGSRSCTPLPLTDAGIGPRMHLHAAVPCHMRKFELRAAAVSKSAIADLHASDLVDVAPWPLHPHAFRRTFKSFGGTGKYSKLDAAL